jgi:hypothetical protein
VTRNYPSRSNETVMFFGLYPRNVKISIWAFENINRIRTYLLGRIGLFNSSLRIVYFGDIYQHICSKRIHRNVLSL